ncbi:MAG: class I tRNA ligase family protein, partial [Desulfobacteraceae bacterium]|nr:class I tRNA ligase family protein [Desulfobacteraceae bacterium]
WLEKQGRGKKTINYRLRDWGISRQRYWGSPIPVIHCPDCGIVPVPEQDLPVTLPEDVDLLAKGESPLATLDSFVNIECPKCKRKDAKRDTDTMDTFVESSWYYLRYCSPRYDQGMFDKEAVDYWMPVDQYIGGVEHAVMHLLYSRYFMRVLKSFDMINFKEPFTRLLTQGMVCKETLTCPEHGFIYPEESEIKADGQVFCTKCNASVEVGRVIKMSKSKKNVINPNDLLKKYGADVTRLFCLFAAPPERDLEWNDDGVEGCNRFINRVWRLIKKYQGFISDVTPYAGSASELSKESKSLYIKANQTIKKVTDDIEDDFHFNTAISAVMELVNTLYSIDVEVEALSDELKKVISFCIENILILLSPIVPHFSEELWEKYGRKSSIIDYPWPEYREDALQTDEVIIVVQVNGKLRSKFTADVNTDDEAIKKAALSDKNVLKHTSDKDIKKVIVIRKKQTLVNIVV